MKETKDLFNENCKPLKREERNQRRHQKMERPSMLEDW
jgi:hypothetical protein